MADADRCTACGDIISEGTQICPKCRNEMITLSNGVGICNCGTALFPDGIITCNNGEIIFPVAPTVQSVRRAAKTIKAFCNSRNSNPETDCIECPIRDMCESVPYTWEV